MHSILCLGVLPTLVYFNSAFNFLAIDLFDDFIRFERRSRIFVALAHCFVQTNQLADA